MREGQADPGWGPVANGWPLPVRPRVPPVAERVVVAGRAAALRLWLPLALQVAAKVSRSASRAMARFLS
ncbi:hypothetical protein [Streptomyces sp. MUM 203J]|uniref:hypothetical protein n=1 Tax=Streptomyces sp. MUM 203J TaxID=2791990 RepID=UPI001F04EB7B|nr:hypothetical protein [Streptomyces sp. MUM 203J]